jgi:hypothetical protein
MWSNAPLWFRFRVMNKQANKLFVSQSDLERRLQDLLKAWEASPNLDMVPQEDVRDTLILGMCDPSTHTSCTQELIVRGIDWENIVPSEIATHIKGRKEKIIGDSIGTSELVIDIERGTITHAKKLIASFPLCHLMSLIDRSRSSHFSEILHVCFGEPDYVTQKHASKIYNLLNRAKRLVGREALFCRSETMHVHPPLTPMKIMRPPPLLEQVLRSKEWQKIRIHLVLMITSRSNPVQRRADRILQYMPPDRPVSRATLQRLTGLSKATVARMIRAAVDQGHVDCFQRGATPLYQRRSQNWTASQVDSSKPQM